MTLTSEPAEKKLLFYSEKGGSTFLENEKLLITRSFFIFEPGRIRTCNHLIASLPEDVADMIDELVTPISVSARVVDT